MSLGLRARLLAAVAAVAIALGGVLPIAPAFADEPTAEPTATPTAEPTTEPSAEPTVEPTPSPEPTVEPNAEPEPTAEPTATPTEQPSPEPTEAPSPAPTQTPTATPTPTATAAPASTISLTGTFTPYSSEDRAAGGAADAEPAGDGAVLFTVPGSGFLRADVSQLPAVTAGSATVRFAVPAGLVLAADPGTAFQQLSEYGSTTAPIVAQSVLPGRVSSRSVPNVNQTPNTAAVHQVYAVLVSPNGGAKGADQTAAKVATAVASASTYWGQQSSGSVTFNLAGTTTWYSSANSCATDAGSSALWNQAASVAASQLGYVAARNVHLVLFFSGSTDCGGGTLGLGTIGWSANEGGAVWVVGTDARMSQGTLAHELGHNLSLGHANWAQCPGASPSYAGYALRDNCSVRPYGDLTDVMAFSQFNRTGGALSSAQAIRASLWPTSSYENAPVGTTDYTLSAVSGNSGLRSVVIEDPYNGDRFFVEFRTYTDEDAQYAGSGCDDQSCVAASAGVRVLRFDDDYSFVSFPGDDSYLLGRTTSAGAVRINYVAGETFSAEGASFGLTPQVKVQVMSVGATTATVRVTRPPLGSSPTSQLVRTDFVSIVPTLAYDQSFRVGDTWTAMLGSGWSAESYAFQWYRDGVPIGGATQATYTIAAADLGKGLRVSVTASSTGAFPASRTDPEDGVSSYGPIIKGVYRTDQPGSVAITGTGATLQAANTSWPSGTTFSYQWYRGASASTATTAIAGATSATYAQVAASDAMAFVRVRVTATPPGYGPVMRYSTARNYTITAKSGSVATVGAPAVGKAFTLTNSIVYSTLSGAITPAGFTYQWLRNGTAISGATQASYTPVAADYQTALSVRVTTAAPGYLQHSAVSAPSALVAIGTIQQTATAATVTRNPTTLVLTAQLPSGSVQTSGVTLSYQWFRGALPIAGATTASYQLAAADYNQNIGARITLSKAQYTSVTIASPAWNYSVRPSSITPAVIGELRVGGPITIADRSYIVGSSTVAAAEAVQWLRNGVAIAAPLGTGRVYVPVSADLGAALSARVTASVPGYLPAIATSAGTAGVGANSFEGWNDSDVATVTPTGGTVLSAGGTGITGPLPLTTSYQWYRGSTAVSGATQQAYSLSAADYGQAVWVRVTTSKPTYTTIVKDSVPVDYSITGATPVISSVAGPWRAGEAVRVSTPSYFIGGSTPVVPAQSWQWFRNGVAIAGATASTYVPASADYNQRLTVTVTASAPGRVSRVVTTAPTPVLGAGVISGALTAPTVARSTTGVLTAALPAGSVTTPQPTVAYQWYRNATPITGAAAATYLLAAADYGATVSVRASVSKLNFNTVALPPSAAVNYSLVRTSALTVVGAVSVGSTLTPSAPVYTALGSPVAPAFAYQWLRNGQPIAGALAASYLVQPADLGTRLSVQVGAAVPGVVRSIVVSSASAVITQGVWAGTFAAPQVTASAGGLLSAVVPAGALTTPGVALTYQWYRGTAAIAGATAATYQLAAADWGTATTIRVRIVATKSAMQTPTRALPDSAAVNYSLQPTAGIAVTGAAKVGVVLGLSPAAWAAKGAIVVPTIQYQWLRDGMPIAGATASTYAVASADLGAALAMRLTVSSPGALGRAFTTAATAKVVAGTLVYSATAKPVVTASAAGLLTAALPPGAVTTPGVTLAYQWYRGATAVSTGPTYQLTAADSGTTVRVTITASKANVAPASFGFASTGVNYTVTASASPVASVVDSLVVGGTVTATTGTFSSAGGPVAPVLSYQWLRDGLAIGGATGVSYLIQPADFETELSVRVTATTPGLLPLTATSAVTAEVGAGALVVHDAVQPLVAASAGGVLTATVPAGTVETSGAAVSFQWLRDWAPIAGATLSTYALSADDYGTALSVIATVTKANVVPASVQLAESAAVDYSVVPDAAIDVTGDAAVDGLLTAGSTTYTAGGAPVAASVTYQWLRDGSPIAGAGTSSYSPQPDDFGAVLSVRVSASAPGWITAVVAPAAAAPIGEGAVAGTLGSPAVTSAGGLLSATLPAGTITNPGVTLSYQWLRDALSIADATAATYALVAGDAGHTISVQVTVSKPHLLSDAFLQSPGVDYGLTAAWNPAVGPAAVVGVPLAPTAVPYTASTGPVTPTLEYQWLRDGTEIDGAEAATYTPGPADVGKALAVRVIAHVPGFLSLTTTSAETDPVALAQFTGTFAVPVVSPFSASVLVGALPAGSIDQAATLAYQWLRDGSPIAGATAAKYTLAASTDTDTQLAVTITASLPGFVPQVLTSAAVASTISAAGAPVVTGGPVFTVALPTYAPAASAVAYQWYVNGVAVVGAAGRGATYQPAASSAGRLLTVRVTASQAGYLSVSLLSDPVTIP